MRSVPAALQSKLDSGATTLAQCWVVRRRDGAVVGFTDHDRDLVAGAASRGLDGVHQHGLALVSPELAGLDRDVHSWRRRRPTRVSAPSLR